MRKGPLRQDSVFRFLHRAGAVETAADWDRKQDAKLWRYNLHYFDWLREQAACERVADDASWMNRWIAENPVGYGTGWEPYPLSLRIVNWIVWLITIGISSERHIESLAAQARRLEQSIEVHLLGNHLLANAKALVFAGAFFHGAEAERWLARGLNLLASEIPEQILADGAHFELSPMYHAQILEDVLDLLGLAAVYPSALGQAFASMGLSDVAARMVRWLDLMRHPDGQIAYFNDASFDIAPAPAELIHYAASRGVTIETGENDLVILQPSGYAVVASGPFRAIFDCGRIGPDYLPGHAHADTLSFELSIGRDRLISNSGTSTYERGPQREWERSTRAHATVEIDGYSSAETWASFRVGRRPNVGPVEYGSAEAVRWVECRHDGYAHLTGAPMHRRRICISPNGCEIGDRIEGGGRHTVSGYLPLHPGVRAAQKDDHAFRLRMPGGNTIDLHLDGPITSDVQSGQFAPGFGLALDRPVIVWQFAGELPVNVQTRLEMIGKYPPAEPGALRLEPPGAAEGVADAAPEG